jgi:hypothetical protein
VGSLSGGHKTNITSVETALTTVIDSLTNPADASQMAAKAVFVQMRTQLVEAMKILRSQ